MNSLFSGLSFFASPGGLTLLGVIAAAIVLLWEWRLALLGLFIIQVGVTAAAVHMQQMPAEWAIVIAGVGGLACLMLAMSAQRIDFTGTLYQSGTWLQRTMILALFGLLWRLSADSVQLPEIAPALVQLFTWLLFCLLTIMALSENPLFTGVALLMWIVPVQVVAASLVGVPMLIALIGLLQILLALACSYLVLVEQTPAENVAPVLTDISFPKASPARVRPLAETQDLEDRLTEWLGRQARAGWTSLREVLSGRISPPRNQS